MLEYQMEKLRQGSTERKELEDGLITKQRDRKGKECSSIIKARGWIDNKAKRQERKGMFINH